METLAKVEEGGFGPSTNLGTFGNMPCQKCQGPKDKFSRIMSIDLIAQSIFEYLNLEDLKSCTLVRKSWTRVARLTMHKCQKCRITLCMWKSKEDRLKEFLNLVENSTTFLPYNHLSIFVKHNIFHCTDYENCQERLGECLRVFRHWDKLRFQKLTVQDSDVHHPHCILLSSLKVMFEKQSLDLKCLEGNVKSFDLIFKDHHKKMLLSKLITLGMDLNPTNQDSIFHAIVHGGIPLLKELMGRVNQMQLQFFISNEKGCLVKNCDFPTSLTSTELETIFSFAMDPLVKLRKFAMQGCANPSESQNIFEHVIELILNNSELSLEELTTNLGIINFISKIRTQPLKNVNRLNLLFSKGEFKGDGLLHAIPIANLFPTLKTVIIFDNASIDMVDIIPNSFLAPDRMLVSVCVTVKELTFESSRESLKRPFMYALWKMFPNVNEFTYEKPPSSSDFKSAEILIRSWHFLFTERIWPGLEVVKVNADAVEIKALEPYIIGVSDEELQNWRTGIYGYMNMRNFQYAASRVYILNRRELKKVVFGLYNGYEGFRPFVYADACGFSRKQNLHVETTLLADKSSK